MTKFEFIEKSKSKHLEIFEKSFDLLPDKILAKDKIKIICKIHGEFELRADMYIFGKGCQQCSKQNLTIEEFIKRAKTKHGNKYDYSKVEYIDSRTPIIINCPEHGPFQQIPANHLFGQGCPKCAGNKKLTYQEIINKAMIIHGNKYNYDNLIFSNNKDIVEIICPEHGPFQQRLDIHLFGQGCPKCKSNYKSDTKDFIEKAIKIHGDKYIYDKSVYTGAEKNLIITCKIHGDFLQQPQNHLTGKGCPKCAIDKSKMTKEEFIEKAIKIHGNKYDYSKVEYKGSKEYVTIICPEHGEFQIVPNGHLNGNGCLKCSLKYDKKESELKDYIKSLGFNFIENDRKILNGKELDIYIPEKKIALEFNGILWHSEIYKDDKKYHYWKSFECEKQGIRLIHVWEHLWNNPLKQKIIKNIIKSSLGLTKSIYARNCIIELIDLKTCSKFEKEQIINFFDNNNINGYRVANYCTLLRYNNEIVHAFTWGNCYFNKNIQYELIRGASKQGYRIIGGSSKLWKFFIEKFNPKSIVYYIDYNLFDGKSIEHLNPKPEYINHSLGFWNYDECKQILSNRNPSKNNEINKNENIVKIYHAGTKTYIWRKE